MTTQEAITCDGCGELITDYQITASGGIVYDCPRDDGAIGADEGGRYTTNGYICLSCGSDDTTEVRNDELGDHINCNECDASSDI